MLLAQALTAASMWWGAWDAVDSAAWNDVDLTTYDRLRCEIFKWDRVMMTLRDMLPDGDREIVFQVIESWF